MALSDGKNLKKETLEELKKVIAKQIDEMIEAELEAVAGRIRDKKTQIITGVLLSFQKVMEFDRLGEKLHISVKLEE